MKDEGGGSVSGSKFDDYASQYTECHQKSIRASGEDVGYFAEYKVRCLERHGVPLDQPLLDFGCGIGNVTTRMARVYENVHGYDPSAESLRVLEGRLPGATLHGSIDAIPPEHFETAVMSGVLHHVRPEERTELLAQVYRKLRPGGRLFVFEHNPLNPLTRRVVATCPFDDDAVMLWPWPARRLLLQSCGFVDLHLEFIVFFPRALAWLRWLEPHLRWLLLGAQFLLIARKPD